MSSIIVLGAGMVGSAMAIDLADQHRVVLADINTERLSNVKQRKESLITQVVDVTQKETLKEVLRDFDLVLCAVPGFLGFETLKAIIEAKKNVIDISFFPEDSLSLNQLAIDNDVTAIVDIGVAPGMDNLILGRLNEEMTISTFACYVGGLPKIKKWPFNYKAPFSPIDVIEEYTRPARYVENGNLVVKPALSDVELMEFDGIGTLEAFNSDGLRSILYTMSHIPNMIEKTLRYPGHCEYISVLKEAGFFDEEESISIKGANVSPLSFTSKVLFKEWNLGDEEELTVMRVIVEGKMKGADKRFVYDLFDRYDSKSATSSMSRCTGYTATAAVTMFLKGMWKEKGLFPPELIAKDEACFNYILEYLKQRGVNYRVSEN